MDQPCLKDSSHVPGGKGHCGKSGNKHGHNAQRKAVEERRHRGGTTSACFTPNSELIGLRSTAGLMAGIVYGGDIQSIGTDH